MARVEASAERAFIQRLKIKADAEVSVTREDRRNSREEEVAANISEAGAVDKIM